MQASPCAITHKVSNQHLPYEWQWLSACTVGADKHMKIGSKHRGNQWYASLCPHSLSYSWNQWKDMDMLLASTQEASARLPKQVVRMSHLKSCWNREWWMETGRETHLRHQRIRLVRWPEVMALAPWRWRPACNMACPGTCEYSKTSCNHWCKDKNALFSSWTLICGNANMNLKS
jgi:hypothetical protein